ncbi:hypothetical protein V6R85_24185 [Agrobacterium sp. CCNWLW32]|uniref:hypothetical protein n=1 Tax=Agrobacterium sp. CCNWLW32 TaxID=3122072 RepID=UPI00300F9723
MSKFFTVRDLAMMITTGSIAAAIIVTAPPQNIVDCIALAVTAVFVNRVFWYPTQTANFCSSAFVSGLRAMVSVLVWAFQKIRRKAA